MRTPAVAAAVAAAIITAGPVAAETLRSETAFNTSVQQQAAQQPAGGMAVTYPITYSGGALDGCTAEVAESLFPYDEGSWGIYEVAADVTCGDGGFAFTSSGSWDAKGFHGAGRVTEGSGTGSYEGLAGRIAQSGGLTPAADGTADIAYEIMIDRAAP
jgi:hypothetical protein